MTFPGQQLLHGYLNAQDQSTIVYLGIIDYLVPFSLIKKFEQGVKGLVYDKVRFFSPKSLQSLKLKLIMF